MVHALRPGGGDTHAWAGVERTLTLFASLGNAGVLPTIAGLFGLGLLLAFARLRSGGLWLSIGIHAAWVAIFRMGWLVFAIRPKPIWLIGPGWPPIVGGAAGRIAVAAALAAFLLALRTTRLPLPPRAPTFDA
jgi:Type II CAAX prenyl endopeptidase Rce1-like